MASVREVQCYIGRHSSVPGRCSIFLQTPLALSAETLSDGWVTYIKFMQGWERRGAPANRVIARIDRISTRTDKIATGLRRRLKHEPWARDVVRVFGDHTEYHSRTCWYRANHRWRPTRTPVAYFNETMTVSSRSEGVSFNPAELYSFLAGVRDSGYGVPLLDWLAEHTTEFAPYITSAGWLPRDEAEMVAVRKKRETDPQTSDLAPLVFSDDPTDLQPSFDVAMDDDEAEDDLG